MVKTDERGQLYELHKFNSGLGVWMYSDKLHKIFAVANLYGLDVYRRAEFEKAESIYNKKGYTVLN